MKGKYRDMAKLYVARRKLRQATAILITLLGLIMASTIFLLLTQDGLMMEHADTDSCYQQPVCGQGEAEPQEYSEDYGITIETDGIGPDAPVPPCEEDGTEGHSEYCHEDDNGCTEDSRTLYESPDEQKRVSSSGDNSFVYSPSPDYYEQGAEAEGLDELPGAAAEETGATATEAVRGMKAWISPEDVGATGITTGIMPMNGIMTFNTATSASTNPNDYIITYRWPDWPENSWAILHTNGNVGFCGDNHLAFPAYGSAPNSVTMDLSFVNNLNMLEKVLFYGFGGPGSAEYAIDFNNPPSGPNAELRNLQTTSAVHRAVHGQWAELWGFGLWSEVAGLPDVGSWGALRFTPENPTHSIVTVDGTQIQRSESIRLDGGPARNAVRFTVPSPYTIRKGDIVYSSGQTAVIYVGESFYVEAPANHSGTFDPGTIWGDRRSANFRVIMLIFDCDMTQRILTWWGEKESVNITINFTGATPAPAEICLAARKDAVGALMTPGQFSFSLYRSDSSGQRIGSPIQTVSNALGGTYSPVLFSVISYTEPGVYYYIMREPSINDSQWVMDTRQFHIRVTVSGTDALTAVAQFRVLGTNDDWVTFNPDSDIYWPRFVNRFGGPMLPETGGPGGFMSVITGLLLMLLGVSALLYPIFIKQRVNFFLRQNGI